MKAIIMAGGDGSRLRPVTCTMPKPMAPVLDIPAMEYSIRLLRAHGVTEIAVTLRYLPDAIREYFGDGSRFGVSLFYYTETAALGTAGGVKQAQAFLDEPFYVLSGDGITDCDLTAAREFHRMSRAEATLVTVRTTDPREYGLVCTAADGRITRFLEKPDWPDVVCDRVSTGLYVLEPSVTARIPEGEFCDFARHIFPAMLRDDCRIYAYDAQCYWCDIGDTAALIRANRDALHDTISTTPMSPDGIWIHPTARVDHRASLEPPVYIGARAHIAAGAVVGPESVVGEGVVLEAGASVRRSVLLPCAHIGRNAQLRGCLIAGSARIGADTQIYEDAVVGANCTVGSGAEIAPGVCIWPDKTIPGHMRVQENIVWGHAAQAVFHSGAVDCFTPVQAVHCAQALYGVLQPRIVLLAHSREPAAEALHHAVCAGLMALGTQIYNCHVAELPEVRSALAHIGADCACCITSQAFYPLDSRGVCLTGEARRKFLACLHRGNAPVPDSAISHSVQSAGRCDLIYLKQTVSDEIIRTLHGFSHPVAVYAANEHLLTLAERALLRAGLTVRAEWEEEMMTLTEGEIGLWLSDSGESVRFFSADGELTEAESQLLMARTLLDMRESTLILPDDATPAIEILAHQHSAQTERVPGGPTAWAARMADAAPVQLNLHFDGIACALRTLAMLHRQHLTLADHRRQSPDSVRRRMHVDIPPDLRAHALETLNALLQPASPGRFCFTHGDNRAWILADEDGCCTVLAESADSETAQEICGFYEKIVRDAVSRR